MRNKLALITLVMELLCAGCSDDESPYSCASCVDEPEANALYDNTGQGIYKGLFIGSSGTIKFNIANNDATISGTLVIDGETIELESEGTYGEGGFEGYLYGTMNSEDDVAVGFHVNSTGTSWGLYGVVIPGHDNGYWVEKEFSYQLIEVFEGTFSGDDAGIFNLIVARDDSGDGEWAAIARSAAYGNYFIEGEIEENEMSAGGDFGADGTIAGDNVSGVWSSLVGGAGTWKGRRTL